MNRIHVIPVGGSEPIHAAHETCRCQPLVGVNGVITHHAQDLREARERHGSNRAGEMWALVEEIGEKDP